MTLIAQDLDNIPSYYGDKGLGTCYLRENLGQLIDTDGDAVANVHYSVENSPVGIHLKTKGEVSFTMAVVDPDTATVDTLYHVEMEFGHGNDVDPEPLGAAVGGLNNYYRSGTSVEGAQAFPQVVYRSAWDSINAYFYTSLGGPRMAFVVIPGGDPADISLKFAGQDSMALDWQGALKLYVGGKWIRLEEARAYQVNANNAVVPVWWSADYDYVDGNAFVNFEFYDYDTSKPIVFEIGYPPMPQGAGGGGGGNMTWSTTAGGEFASLTGDYFLGGEMLPDRDLVVTGNTADQYFPAVTGSVPFLVGRDVFVSRYNYLPGDDVDDAKLLWTTFIIGGPIGGGTGSGFDMPSCVKYAPEHDRLYVGGWTNSLAWPLWPPTNPNDGSFYQSARKGARDGFIMKLTVDGILERNTYYGGGGDDVITTITADDFGRVHCFGVTNSPTGSYNSCNSPTSGLPLCDPNTNNYQQDDNAGGLDMFVARLDEDFHLTWGSFIGDTGDDRVVDSDYKTGASSTVDHIAISGRTTSSFTYTVQTGFQLSSPMGTASDGNETGFLWLWNSDGRPGWGTHIHGTHDLQAVSFADGFVRVLGVTKSTGSMPVINSCNAVPGSLSICGGESELEYQEHYLAEFDLGTYTMKFSSLQGGLIDARLTMSTDAYHLYLFDTQRMMDMRTNANDDYMYMGVVEQAGPGMISDYPTLGMWGMYDKLYDAGMGYWQTEVFISLRRYNHQLVYTTMFGSHFDHIPNPDDEEHFDFTYQQRCCDFGHDLLWADGEVLYLVGTTGGFLYDRQCPTLIPPAGSGLSYCELSGGPLEGPVDCYDGMIARFDLQEISIGMSEEISSSGLLIFPNPSADALRISAPPAIASDAEVIITDALGRVVLSVPFAPNAPISIAHLASGAYTLRLLDHRNGKPYTAQFIRR